MSVLFAWIQVPCVCSTREGQKRVSESPELDGFSLPRECQELNHALFKGSK